MQNTKAYFPGLNGLRFFAAFAVLITHVEFTKKLLHHGDIFWLNIPTRIQGSAWESIMNGNIHWLSPFITHAGYMGVIFFFVLSGYLITYLLLEEKKVSNGISIRNFYVRRLLRIWPLYLLLVVLGFFVFPHVEWFRVPLQEDKLYQYFELNFFSYLFMIPNFAFAIIGMGVPIIGHLWSIGVEEQFYVLWPIIIKYAKKPFRAILVFLGVVIAIKLALFLIPGVSEPIRRLAGSLKFESMALGALGACLIFYKKENWLRFIYSRTVQVLAYLSLPVIILFTPKSMYISLYLMFSIPFLIIIMNVSTNKGTLLKLENKLMSFLGRISYGLYIYHFACITFSFYLIDHFMHFPRHLTHIQSFMLYLVSIPMTIVVAALSQRYFEKKFIDMKRKFTTIVSGDDAKGK